MIRHWTLNIYLGRQYLMWFLIFMGALAGVIFLFEVAELFRRAAERQDAGFLLILKMGIYKMPETIEKTLPFVVLFSGMFTFWRLTRSQELIIARSTGVSAWQFLLPALAVTLIFSFINVTVINPIGASFNSKYKAMEMRYLQRSPVLELTGAGLWLRQRDNDRRYLLHADHVLMDPLRIFPLMVFIYDDHDKYLGRIDAPEAVLGDGHWHIESGWLNLDQKMPESISKYRINTSLTLDKIQESLSPPNTISFWELPTFVRALKAIGLPPRQHELAFQTLLAQPILLCAMIFFAAAFALRMGRRGNILNIVIVGVLLGSMIFTLNNVVTALGANQTLPVILSAWAIPLVALALSNAALIRLEDG